METKETSEIQNENRKKPEYQELEFWNLRYTKNPGYYDWYLSYKELKELFEKSFKLDKNDKILNVGCGNSKSIFEMAKDGYENTVNVDYSDVVINKMESDAQEMGIQDKLKFEIQDCTCMEYKDQSFDVVFDKGTLDAIVCGGNYQDLLGEMARVVKVQGQIIIVSYGNLRERREVFRECFGFEDFEYSYQRVNLSSMAQLVNMMRASSDLPLNELIKNKVEFLKIMIQFQQMQKNMPEEDKELQIIDWDQEYQQQEQEEEEKEEQEEQEDGEGQQQENSKEITENNEQNTENNEQNNGNNDENNDQNTENNDQNTENSEQNTENDDQNTENNEQNNENTKKEEIGTENNDDDDDDDNNNIDNQGQQKSGKHRKQQQVFVYQIRRIK